MEKKLYKSNADRKLAGVCGGLADYFHADSTLIRLIWIGASLVSGVFPGLIAYVAAAVIMPEDPIEY